MIANPALRRPDSVIIDEFAGTALAARWTPVAGTFDVTGGALRALTMANWLGNRVTNGEFAVDTSGWTAGGAITVSRVDSALDPGAVSGGVDSWCVKLTHTAIVATGYVFVAPASVLGMTYTASVRAYAPSANAAAMAAGLVLQNTGSAEQVITSEDAWQILSVSGVAVGATTNIVLKNSSTTLNDLIYFDRVLSFGQAAALVARFGPNPTVILSVANPAAPTVTPFGWRVRIQDSLNYWEVRRTPNTAGTDLELIEVIAGVEAQRVPADVDWTASATDQIRVRAYGTTIRVDTKKSGETAWTQRINYTSATNFATAGLHGPLYYGTATNPLVRVEVVA